MTLKKNITVQDVWLINKSSVHDVTDIDST